MSQRVLLVGVPARVARALAEQLPVDVVAHPEQASERHYHVAVVGPDPAVTRACQEMRDTGRVDDVVFLGGAPSLQDAIAAIRAGAADFVPDGTNPHAVKSALDAVLERRDLREELARIKESAPVGEGFSELVGESDAMRRLRVRIQRASGSDVTVLIQGDSGTGKELVARALHRLGPRRSGPFVAVACGAVPRHLVDSEFFGHVRGAFTDASRDRAGLLREASGGTLLLDEVTDMPLELQAKLLRALQQRTVRPLGSQVETAFDVRLVAASSRDLDQEVASGRLRHDLYFRLNVLRIKVPPLRGRGRDVLLLAQHFIEHTDAARHPLKGLTPAAARALMRHDWPGNVRELRHCIEAAAASARFDHVTTMDLPEAIRGDGVCPDPPAIEPLPLSVVERDHILGVLESVGGNKAQAAKLLGLDRKTLHRRLKQYAVAEDQDRGG